jgi:hypothetical protein
MFFSQKYKKVYTLLFSELRLVSKPLVPNTGPDCNVYVKSKRAGERLMLSITKFITIYHSETQTQSEHSEKCSRYPQ